MRWLAILPGLLLLAATAQAQQDAQAGTGAVLRALDRLSGEITDVELASGGSFELGRLTVSLRACRYPPENPAGEAFGYLTIIEDGAEAPTFDGWMVASSPALNALEHPRYDVWVLRCKTE